MIRIAFLEKENTAKDLVFECAKVLQEIEWTFSHYTKISEFAKAEERFHFDIIFFNEVFHTPRISTSFIEHHPKRIVVYCMNQLTKSQKEEYPTGRILYINRTQVKSEMERIKEHLLSLLRSHKEYLLSYNNVLVPLRMQDIYYIEKHEKNLIYHTTRGIFKERKTMTQAEQYFAMYDFLRIHASYLVNVQRIIKIQSEFVELDTHEVLPIARARRKEVIDWFHHYVKVN